MADFTWRIMKATFPSAHAAVIMPNHVHLLVATEHAGRLQQQMKQITFRIVKKFNLGPHFFEPISVPTLIPDLHHLKRQVRYVHLNPCRKKLTSCPLEWPYSTHRDALGLRLYPWMGAKNLLTKLNILKSDFHYYVSADPSCHVLGTQLPTTTSSHEKPAFPVHLLEQSVQSLLNPIRKSDKRQLLLWLLDDQGFRELRVQQLALGVTGRRIQQLKLLPAPPTSTQHLLRTILHDPRLRKISF